MTWKYRQTGNTDAEFWIENERIVREPVIRVSFHNSKTDIDDYERIIRLIAAAPELLQFAKDIQQMIDDNPDLDNDLCACTPQDNSVGWYTNITCTIHALPELIEKATS